MCQWFLYINMLAQLHGCKCCNGMCIIRCRNRNSIYIAFFFLKHLSKIFMVRCFWKFLPGIFRLPVIYIAECNNIYIRAFCKLLYIAFPFTACANTGDVKLITRRYKSPAQYMPGNNKKACCRNGCVAYKITT